MRYWPEKERLAAGHSPTAEPFNESYRKSDERHMLGVK